MIETNASGLMPFIEYHPMVSHEVGDAVSSILLHSVNRCCVIEDGIYFEVISAGEIGSYALTAIGIELPQDRAEEVCEIIQALKEL